MKDAAIKNICSTLMEQYNISLKNMTALDFFAREGDWQTQYYAKKVKKLYAWEVDPIFEQKLKSNLPKGTEITIGNSFALAKEKNNFFDLVVLDNPQGCYGNNNMYCEHFEAIDPALELLKFNGGLLIFNVKTTPFNYEDKIEWQKRRNDFYSMEDCSDLNKEFIFDFYEKYFSERDYITKFAFLEKRPQETGLYAYTTQIIRNSDDN
jgi:hypothetical protein